KLFAVQCGEGKAGRRWAAAGRQRTRASGGGGERSGTSNQDGVLTAGSEPVDYFFLSAGFFSAAAAGFLSPPAAARFLSPPGSRLLVAGSGGSSARGGTLGRFLLFLLLGLLDHDFQHADLGQAERAAPFLPALLVDQDLDALGAGQDVASPGQGVLAA